MVESEALKKSDNVTIMQKIKNMATSTKHFVLISLPFLFGATQVRFNI
jgi:hypothetical protein